MRTDAWARYAWTFLFGLPRLMGYSDADISRNTPFQVHERAALETLFCLLSIMLPCSFCREGFNEWSSWRPMHVYVHTVRDFVQYLSLLKCNINRKLVKADYRVCHPSYHMPCERDTFAALLLFFTATWCNCVHMKREGNQYTSMRHTLERLASVCPNIKFTQWLEQLVHMLRESECASFRRHVTKLALECIEGTQFAESRSDIADAVHDVCPY